MLVVIDPAVEAPQKLAEGLQASATSLLLDLNSDSMAQITRALATGNYRSLHIVSHGSSGCLHLGNTNLNVENIERYRLQIMDWGRW